MATDKNTLKNWFKTGLKPLQAHFWALLESYWHKDEKIPMQNIEGIDTILENKAETAAVDAKANADASGLSDENIISWKEALGVGEVPDNMAKIDKEGEQGNVHTKEQIEALLENSGKNISNADMKVPEGTERTLDLTNAKILLKGLENKKGDASYNRRIKANERGELVFTDDADVNVYIPENTTVTGVGIGNQTITVNHIYPNPIPNPATIPNRIQELMGQFKNLRFKPFVAHDFMINNLEDGETSPRSVFADGMVKLQNNPQNKGRDNIYANAISRTFPHDKQWVIKLNINPLFNHHGRMSIGLTQANNPNDLMASFILALELWGNYGNKYNLAGGAEQRTSLRSLHFVVAHANNVIYASVTNERGETQTKVIGNFDANGDYRILGRLDSLEQPNQKQNLLFSGEYWIEE